MINDLTNDKKVFNFTKRANCLTQFLRNATLMWQPVDYNLCFISAHLTLTAAAATAKTVVPTPTPTATTMAIAIEVTVTTATTTATPAVFATAFADASATASAVEVVVVRSGDWTRATGGAAVAIAIPNRRSVFSISICDIHSTAVDQQPLFAISAHYLRCIHRITHLHKSMIVCEGVIMTHLYELSLRDEGNHRDTNQ